LRKNYQFEDADCCAIWFVSQSRRGRVGEPPTASAHDRGTTIAGGIIRLVSVETGIIQRP
jgi:hypothetical protein